ncbi:MAG: DUF3109 family protein, partial [Bacteroidia bacterium]|nr:DUF3109 family protein [Bacteroidia bacterium]
MIEHGNTLISTEIFDRHFVCNLDACKGACCVEGDNGAPLDEHELGLIEQDIEAIKPFMSEDGLALLKAHNFFERDEDGDLVTTCLPTGECVFATYDQNRVLGCGIENAFKAGKTTFKKPISCHLYPIRINKVGTYDALNYHKWEICKAA